MFNDEEQHVPAHIIHYGIFIVYSYHACIITNFIYMHIASSCLYNVYYIHAVYTKINDTILQHPLLYIEDSIQ